jgi:hypothetical protein
MKKIITEGKILAIFIKKAKCRKKLRNYLIRRIPNLNRLCNKFKEFDEVVWSGHYPVRIL